MASIQVRKETGTLIIDFYFRGQRCREQTALADTPVNRKRLGKVLASIEEEIAQGKFDYRRFFPSSKNAVKFYQVVPENTLTAIAHAVSTGVPFTAHGFVSPSTAPPGSAASIRLTCRLQSEFDWK